MKSNIVIFWILTVYFVLVTVMYGVWNQLVHDRVEWIGLVALFGCAAFNAFIAFYLQLVQKKQGGILTEDLDDADIDDGDPELGHFSPWSWWPIALAASCALALMGMAIGFGFWLAFFSIPLILVTIVGWVYEYYRGYFAR